MHLLWKVSMFALFAVLSQADTVDQRNTEGSVPLNKRLSAVWKFFHGFGRNKKVDCLVSETWSAWEGPNGFGGYERYRSIITQPQNGGRPCPSDLVQTRPGPKPTVKQIAKTVEKNFLRRGGQSSKRDFNPFEQTDDLVRRQAPGYKSRDLLVIIDSSGSVTSNGFTEAKNDIAELLGLLCPADASNDPFKSSDISYHQAAFMQFSSYADEEFDFDDKHPTSTLQSAIRSIPYNNGGTATDLAFEHAITMFNSDNRGLRNSAFVQKEVLILTDGQSNCKDCSIQAAEDLKSRTFGPNDDQVKVYGLIIGGFTDRGQDEVKQYVSHPPGQHLFALNSFDQLKVLLKEIKDNIGNHPCVHFNIG